MHASMMQSPQPTPIPGVRHATLARRDDGVALSVWRQQIDAGQGTPEHSHDCDEIVTVLAGTARVQIGRDVLTANAGDTVVLPAGADHRIDSVGAAPLQLVAVFAASPVRTRAPGGAELQLPWPT